MQRRTIGRGLGAVLFTDIVGSTTVAAEMGNSRWGELVSRHHQLIRRELRRFGGREQDTAGDGFFATFERPVDAIHCAVAAAEAVRALGIEIRAGVSFGQLELVEGKAGGLIVNTAARMMSVAGAGEVLVPAAVKDLVPGTGISFGDHGAHRLKGIEGEVRLFRVTEVDGRVPSPPLDPAEAAERRGAIVPVGGRRTGLVAGGLAAAVVAVVGVWVLLGDDEVPPRESRSASRFVVEIDPETGSDRQRIDFPDPGRPESFLQSSVMAAGQSAVWTEDPTAFVTTILRVDPRHREVQRVVVGPSFSFSISIATAFDAVWVLTDRLARINPATNDVRRVLTIPLPSGGAGGTALGVSPGHLWVGTTDGDVLRIDPSGEVTERRSVTDSIQLVAAGNEGVWVVDQFAGAVLRMDPRSLRTVATIPFTGNVDAIAVMDDHVWALDFRTGLLRRISIVEDREVGQVAVPAGATSLAVGLDAVWIADEEGRITRVDPLTMQPSFFAEVDGSVRAIAVDQSRESIWVDVSRSD